MTPSADLIVCANCDCWFTGGSLDEVFYHATCACRRELAASSEPGVAPAQSALGGRP